LKRDFAKVKELKKAFPNAQSILISEKNYVEIESPHAYTLKKQIKRKVLTYAGVKKNSEVKVYYNPAWDEVSIGNVTVTNPDGKQFKLDKTEQNIMDQGWIGSAPRYPAGKILVVNLPGIQPGSFIEYELTVKSQKQPFIDIVSVFEGKSPVISNELKLTYPKRISFKTAPVDDSIVVSESIEKGRVSRSFKMSNMNAVPTEIRTPPLRLFTPTVRISSGDWKEFSKSVKEVLETAAEKQSKTEMLTEKLISGKLPLDAVKALRDYVALNIRRAGPGISALPLECISAADKTLKDAYGNSADSAVLLYAMLKKAGFKPEFLLV
jgi:hypothetical protein